MDRRKEGRTDDLAKKKKRRGEFMETWHFHKYASRDGYISTCNTDYIIKEGAGLNRDAQYSTPRGTTLAFRAFCLLPQSMTLRPTHVCVCWPSPVPDIQTHFTLWLLLFNFSWFQRVIWEAFSVPLILSYRLGIIRPKGDWLCEQIDKLSTPAEKT